MVRKLSKSLTTHPKWNNLINIALQSGRKSLASEHLHDKRKIYLWFHEESVALIVHHMQQLLVLSCELSVVSGE